jgi:hypothetical protein
MDRLALRRCGADVIHGDDTVWCLFGVMHRDHTGKASYGVIPMHYTGTAPGPHRPV